MTAALLSLALVPLAVLAGCCLAGVAEACRIDGARIVLRGLAWAAGRWVFGAAVIESWRTDAAERRRAARRRRLLSQ